MLKILCHVKPTVARALLKGASPDFIKSLSEVCLNVLKGNVPLTPTQKRRLSRFKQDVRCMAKKTTSLKKKKTILQKGGLYFPMLIKAYGL